MDQSFGGFPNIIEYAAAHGLLEPFQQQQFAAQHQAMMNDGSMAAAAAAAAAANALSSQPPGFKPTFYNPFQVKHRRRTTRNQFKVLEKAFHENSKPNGSIRRLLAEKLGMTPRGVQVWFQNRRAKAKAQRAKEEATSHAGSGDEEVSNPCTPPSTSMNESQVTPSQTMSSCDPTSPDTPSSPPQPLLSATEWSQSLNLDAQAAAKRCQTRTRPPLPTLKMPSPETYYNKVFSKDESIQFLSPVDSDFSASLTPSPMASSFSASLSASPMPSSASTQDYFLAPPQSTDMARRNSCPADFIHSFLHLGFDPDQENIQGGIQLHSSPNAFSENENENMFLAPPHDMKRSYTESNISHGSDSYNHLDNASSFDRDLAFADDVLLDFTHTF